MKLMKSRDPWFPTMFDEFFNMPLLSGKGTDFQRVGCEVPAVNIHDIKDEFFLEMAVPGLKKEDFILHLEHGVLSVSSEKESKTEETNENITKREFNYSSFKRSFTLPDTVESEKINAEYKNGILKIHLPKRKEAEVQASKQIKIQ